MPNPPESGVPAQPPPLPAPRAATTSGLAVVSLVLGLLGFLILPAVAGLVCGLVANGRIRRSNGHLKGAGFALSGMILSGAMLLVAPFIAIIAGLTLPALANAKSRAQQIMSLNNVRQMCLGAMLWADDNDGKFPDGPDWCDTIASRLGSPMVLQRPSDPTHARCGYGYNARIAGVKQAVAGGDTVVFFELQNPGWNVSGGPELLRRPSGRRDAVVVGFSDGHAEAVMEDRLANLRWDP